MKWIVNMWFVSGTYFVLTFVYFISSFAFLPIQIPISNCVYEKWTEKLRPATICLSIQRLCIKETVHWRINKYKRIGNNHRQSSAIHSMQREKNMNNCWNEMNEMKKYMHHFRVAIHNRSITPTEWVTNLFFPFYDRLKWLAGKRLDFCLYHWIACADAMSRLLKSTRVFGLRCMNIFYKICAFLKIYIYLPLMHIHWQKHNISHIIYWPNRWAHSP